MTPRRPPDWSARLLALCAAISFALGFVGFSLAYPHAGAKDWFDILIRTVRLFSLNYDKIDGIEPLPETLLYVARAGAFLTTIWALLKAFFPQVRHHLRRMGRGWSQSCALVLGYGPIGQAIASGLRQDHTGVRLITAVHPVITPDLAARARMDNVLLVEGDPSDASLLARVYAGKARRIYVSDSDDLRAIDTAVAVRKHLPDQKADIRVVLNDSAVAGQMAEATSTGFLGAPGLSWFSLADEAARLLIAEARFDRVAVETGAERLHLVILGCGSQGEAIAVETLLTGWRTSLGPPRITFLDKNADNIKARMRRRMPAWFLQVDGAALPPSARPQMEFISCNAETLDFLRESCLDDLRQGVTAWVFATGNDALNLRTSLALHRAITMRAIDPAPIHVRIPSGHSEDAPELVGQPLTMTRTFGAIDAVVTRSAILNTDPDDLPRKLHAAYAEAAEKMGLTEWRETWESLPESKRNANRALFRHAAMKLEDFGAETQAGFGALARVSPGLRGNIAKVDALLDYGPEHAASTWFKQDGEYSADDIALALQLRAAAVCEHNRWTIERALEQYTLPESPDRTLRDNERRVHPYMHNWYGLTDANTRRFDVVLLRALLEEAAAKGAPSLYERRAKALLISMRADNTTNVMLVPRPGMMKNSDATELHLHLFSEKASVTPDTIAALKSAVAQYVDSTIQAMPGRIRFDFTRMPSESMLAMANALAVELRALVGPGVMIEPLWNWRADPGPRVGFVGHRDLGGFGDRGALEDRLRAAFMTLAVDRRSESLICGYAPGADQVAVAAWKSLGLPAPRLVFPYAVSGPDGATVFHTDDPAQATPETRVPKNTAWDRGVPGLPESGTGHRAQADTVLGQADVLVAVLDRAQEGKPGGTKETVERAQAKGMDVIEVVPVSHSS